MTNVSNVRATLDRVERDPDGWSQLYYGSYVNDRPCHCYAGHAAILAGDPPDISRFTPELSVFTVSGRFTWHVAMEYLDLTKEQMTRIIYPSNTLDQLRALVAEFIANEEQRQAQDSIASVRR